MQSRLVDGAYFEGIGSVHLLKSLFPNPLRATASTHYRRDEQSNADGNLTGYSSAGGAAYETANQSRLAEAEVADACAVFPAMAVGA